MQVGDTVRAFRLVRKMKQTELAEASSISLDAITRIETGKRSPNLTTLVKLTGALGVPLSVFFKVMEGTQ